MNILQALKQLRDDLKTWFTNNINALNAKIDEKTIPIDSELSSTSTNPVQNKAIKKAIDNIPTFSGDYNDLTNAPDITEDDSGNMVIADESGNIIFKADANGMHTTALSLNGEAAATESYVDNAILNIDIPEVDFTGYATEDFVTSTVESAKEELSESIVAEAEDWKVVDGNGNIIFRVDAEGAHTTNLTLNGEATATEAYVDEAIGNIEFPEADLTGYATEKYVDDAVANIDTPETDLSGYYTKEETDTAINTAKEELSESIVAESDEWKVVDGNGNVIFSVDADGAHTTSLSLNGESVEDIIDERVASLVDSAPDTLNTLNELASALGDDPNFATSVATEIGKKIDKVDGKGLSTNDFTDEYKNTLDNLGSMTFDETDPTVPAWAKSENKPEYTAAEIGLGNVDNTSDADKPVSVATQAAIDSLKDELSESTMSESEEWIVVDDNGNIITAINDNGIETTTLTASVLLVNGMDVAEALHSVVDLPPYSSENNSQFLRVVNGVAAWSTVPNAEEATF